MSDSRQAIHDLSRGERGLESACRTLAEHARGIQVDELLRFAEEHQSAAVYLEGLVGARPSSWSTSPWFDRAGALTAALRGTHAIVAFLTAREHDLLHRYIKGLPQVETDTRVEIQARVLPPATSRLAVLDRFAVLAEESYVGA